MFVLAKAYNQLRAENLALRAAYAQLLTQWNEMADKINARGGQDFLDGKLQGLQLESDDINRLLMLCHPDKHGGKCMAVEMTQKLLALRGS
jgi:hypothetical protein